MAVLSKKQMSEEDIKLNFDCREKHKKIREDLRRYLEKKGKLKSQKTLKNQVFEKKYKT